MFESLKEWMTCPFQVKHFEGYTASADKKYSKPVDMIGYFVGGTEVVTDSVGDDVVSSSQIYYDPSVYEIGRQDILIVDGLEKDIITVAHFLDGNFGTSSIKVVYL